MHRHRIRAFVTGSGETDVPTAFFTAGGYVRFVGGLLRTTTLGPTTTTVNAITTWGDTNGTQLLNTTTLLDNAGNMTQLVTLDGQDAPNITAKIGTDPAINEVTVWASTSAPWKLGRRVVTVTPGGDVDNVNTLNGRSPGILVGRSPTSAPSTNSVMVSADGTGIVARGTPVLIDGSGNITGVNSINGTTPADWVQGPAASTDATLVTWNGTTGRIVRSGTTITAAGSQIRDMTLINSIGVTEHGLGGTTSTTRLTDVNAMTLGDTTISNVTAIDGVDPLTWVVGPASVTTNRVATFNGTTGKLIQQSSVAISGGTVTGVSTINGTDPSTWVVGPASSTTGQLATFSGTTGKLIQVATVTASGNALANVGTINTIDPSTWVVGPSSAASGNIATFSGTTGKLIADSGYNLSFILRGSASGFGFSTWVPGYGYTQRASAYKVGYVAFIPVTFPDTSGSVTITVDTTDHNGVWQLHLPASSGYAPMGTGTTFSAGGTYATASLIVAATFNVPSGSGTFNLSVSLSFSSASMAMGFQLWSELSN